MRYHCWSVALAMGLAATLGDTTASLAQPHASQASEQAAHPLNMNFKDLKWERIVPELGERSSEITILRVDPRTQATQLMIRIPKNFRVPKHWHTANETHTVLSGTFIIECEGQRAELGPGSFNYVPSKMPHEAWTKRDEGALLFITVDAGWDINWVGGPPKPEDFTPKPAHQGRGRWRKRKGTANIRLAGGTVRFAELHWYEATGIGRKELKIKRYLD